MLSKFSKLKKEIKELADRWHEEYNEKPISHEFWMGHYSMKNTASKILKEILANYEKK